MGAGASGPVKMSEVDFDTYKGVRYSREVPNSATPNHGATRFTKEVQFDPKVLNLYSNFLLGVSMQNGERPCFGTRKIVNGKAGPYVWITYKEASKRVDNIASGITRLFGIQRQENVGVFSKNRMEWVLAEQALNRMAYVIVPLYDTLGPDAVPYIVNHTEMKLLFCGMDQFKTIIDCNHECPHLKIVVQFEDVTPEQLKIAESHNLILKSLSQVEREGQANPLPADPASPDDVSTLCYTSGTTGNPKGVILTHRNLCTVARFGQERIGTCGDDVHLSYLPLPHVFERSVISTFLMVGSAIGFYQGDVLYLMDDLAALKPTVFPSVPRLFNRVYDKIIQGVAAAGGIKKLLFEQGFAAKKAGLASGHATHALWDALVFSKVRQVLGGRIRVIISGSAPLSAEVKDFLKIVFCCDVVEGYGLTETSSAVTLATGDMLLGPHCGSPFPNTFICLEDVPEMNYTSKDRPRPRGEVLIRGDLLSKGYYKEPVKTAEVFDKDGWFHTGDIGCWNADGTLSIIDRKKNIFKLSQGEYVAPEKVEGVYLKSKYVAQIFVYGDSFQSTLVAIAVPDPDVAEAWAKSKGLTKQESTLNKLVQNKEFQETVAKDMEVVGKAAQLRGFELVKGLHLHYEPFTMESGLVTPTFKLKRPQLKEYFKAQIDRMYGTA